MNKPLKLYEYQKKWMNDHSRFKIGMFARQTGKTLIATLEIVVQVLDAAVQGKTSSWLIVSAREQARNRVAQRECDNFYRGESRYDSRLQ